MTVLPKARQAARRLAVVTGRVCAGCESVTSARCCSPDFCRIVRAGLEVEGLEIPPEPGGYGVPFLDPEHGCTVPPELRPGCTGFVCARAGPDVMRERTKLMRRLLDDPLAARLADQGSRLAGEFLARTLGVDVGTLEQVRDLLGGVL